MKKVMVGMSGGVDSSVAAALLKDEGYEVCGLTLDLLEGCSGEYINDAKKVAKKIDIDHKVLNLKYDFQKNVISYFIDSYQNGLTPNPCLICNQKIKFGAMLDYAIDMGYDYIATGHYVNSFYSEKYKRWVIQRSDSSKDQSYFLYGLTQYQLSRTMFPLKNHEKSDIRRLAKKYDLSVADKSESQDICFIKDTTYFDFIKNQIGINPIPGNFENINGEKVGSHKGITHYTIGQRKGLGISLGKPTYVVKIDSDQNKIVVGDKESGACNELIVKDTNFIMYDFIEKEIKAFAKIRYKASLVSCKVIPFKTREVKIVFDNPIYFPAPGQAVVLYSEGGLVIGGGIIS